MLLPLRRWWMAITLALAAGLGPTMAVAQPAPKPAAPPQAAAPEAHPAQRETEIVRSPDAAPPPPPQTGLLETNVPVIRETLNRQPGFFRDTDLNVRLRTFYFNRQNDNDTASEAWAGGGWVQYASGWLLDVFAIGSTYYTSWPLYTPDGREGTLLLTPDHDSIGVFGEAWAALRFKEYALLRAFRQKIDDGYVNSQDNRMVPNTFEAVTISGILDQVRYNVGYLWEIKPRDSNDFISMSRQAGAGGGDEGLILTSLAFTPMKDLLLFAGNYYAQEVFNTLFAKAEHTHQVNPDVRVQFGLQVTDQRSVGDERVGDFNTWNVGAGARALYKGLSVGAAVHFTGDEASIASPWGSWPGYLSLMVTDFNRANEKAFGVGVKYDFGGTLLPLKAPGLTVHLLYAMGVDREDPLTGNSQANTHEGDLDVIYNVPNVKGLSLRFRNAYVGRGDASTLMDFRLIINYELDLL